jgi:hypothetical protein
MKKLIINQENPKGIIVDMTAEEIAQEETLKARYETGEKANIQAQKDLKTSAKAKLVAGEPLTEAEADKIVL